MKLITAIGVAGVCYTSASPLGSFHGLRLVKRLQEKTRTSDKQSRRGVQSMYQYENDMSCVGEGGGREGHENDGDDVLEASHGLRSSASLARKMGRKCKDSCMLIVDEEFSFVYCFFMQAPPLIISV